MKVDTLLFFGSVVAFIVVVWYFYSQRSGYTFDATKNYMNVASATKNYICNYCSAPGYCEQHYDPLVDSYPGGVVNGMAYFTSSDPCMCCRNSYERRKREAYLRREAQRREVSDKK